MYLELRGPGSASYIFRYTYQGKRRVFSLGPWHLLSLQDARLKAQQLQARVFAGEDVKTKARRQQELEQHKQELEKQPVNKNFSYIVDLWIRSRVEANFWKNNVKGERDTRQKLEKWVYPVIGDRDIEEVDARDMERLFAPIWQSHPSTASKILCWVRKIFQ